MCDTGTGVIKAGFAGENEPCLVFPTLLGRPMLRFDQGLGATQDTRSLYVGDEASERRFMLQLTKPMSNGVICDWDGMEAVWDHTWEQLGINPCEHKVLQTEAALNPPKNREKIVETMFEKYGFAAVNVSVQAILALYSQGLQTGFVVDSGDGVTHMCPVFENYMEPSLVQKVTLAGRHVTDHLLKLLVGQGNPLSSTADFETVREVKQKLCYVAFDPVAEKKLARETTVVDRQYTLPDSRILRVGAERFMAPEILFNPGLADHGDGHGLSELVYDTIMKSDINVRKDYFQHIVLSGGTTMFPGMSSRLEKDLRRLYFERVLQSDQGRAQKFKCFVEDPPRRQSMVFVGGSLLAETCAETAGFWVSRQEYAEAGSSVVRRLIPTQQS